MAVVRDNNKWNADTLAELLLLGSDDGVTSDVVAWAVDEQNWHYPATISTTTSTWDPVASGGAIAQDGWITSGLRFFIDFNNQSSWEPNQLTTWTDTIAAVSGTATDVTVTDGHLNFNGTTARVDFGTLTTALEDLFAGGGTFVAWVRPETDGEGDFGRIVDTQQSTTEGWSTFFRDETGGSAQFGFQAGATTVANNWETTAPIALNEWVMVAVTFDSNSVQTVPVMYVNGVSVAVSTVSAAGATYASDSGNDLYVGNRTDLARTFDGDIEIVALYTAVKSATEIEDIYNATKARFGLGGGSLQNAYVAGNTIVTDSTNGALDVSGTEAISLDAGAASNLTVAGANLDLATTTSGDVTVSSAGTLTLTPTTSLVLDYATWPSADGTNGQVLSTNGAGVLSWTTGGSGGGSAWASETAMTTGASATNTIATPVSGLPDGEQTSVEVQIFGVDSADATNTYYRRQVVTYYRDGGNTTTWTIVDAGRDERRGTFPTTLTAGLTTSTNDVVVNADTTGVAGTINWTTLYLTRDGIVSGGGGNPTQITWNVTTQTASFTAASNTKYKYDASTFSGTISMPASPANGDEVILKNVSSSASAVTISGNGNNIEDPSTYSLVASTTVSGDGSSVTYSFDGTQWLLI
jgi:hypothetical protein